MSLPSELSITLPPTFGTSFWPPDPASQTSVDPSPEAALPAWTPAPYRRPVERAFAALQAGLDLNTRFIQHVQQRSLAEHAYAGALTSPPAPTAFEAPVFPGAAAAERLLNGFEALAADRVPGLAHASSALAAAHTVSSVPLSAAHGAVASALDKNVATPLVNWTADYAAKIKRVFEQLDTQLNSLSDKAEAVERVRQNYYSKCRSADEAEDDEAQVEASPPEAAPETEKPAESPQAMSPQKKEGDLPNEAQGTNAPAPSESAQRPAGPRRQPQRQGTLSSLVHRLEVTAQASPVLSNIRQAVSGLAEPKALRLRREAVQLEARYRAEIAGLDVARADWEREWAKTLGKMQNWETQRGRALKAALGQYASAIAPLLPSGTPAAADLINLPGSYSSTADVIALIRAHGSAPYVPEPPVFVPYYPHDPTTLAGYGQLGFGMHLVRWTRASALAALPPEHGDVNIDALAAHAASAGLPQPPRALRLLLAALARAYADPERWPVAEGVDKDSEEAEKARQAERRRAWIYDVPLAAVHRVRFGLIAALSRAQPDAVIFSRVLDIADPPVLAACVRTWAEELAVSLVPQTLWDTVWSVYRAASDQAESKRRSYESTEEGLPPLAKEDALAIQTATEGDLRSVLLKLPRVHVACLDAIIAPLAALASAEEMEDDPLYAQKIGISLGRSILRPPEERAGTRAARHPALLAMDLVMRYESTLAPVVKEATGRKDYLGIGESDADRRKALAALAIPRRVRPPTPPPVSAQSASGGQLFSSPLLSQNSLPDATLPPKEEEEGLPSKPRMPSLKTDAASLQTPATVGRQPSLRQRGQAALDSIGDAWAQTPLAERVLGFWSESTNRVADGFASLRVQEEDNEEEKTPTALAKPLSKEMPPASEAEKALPPDNSNTVEGTHAAAASQSEADKSTAEPTLSEKEESGNGKPLPFQPADAAAKQPAQAESQPQSASPVLRSRASPPNTATDDPPLGPPASPSPRTARSPSPTKSKSPAPATGSGSQSPIKGSPTKAKTGRAISPTKTPGSPSKAASPSSPKRVVASKEREVPRTPVLNKAGAGSASPAGQTAGTPRATSPSKDRRSPSPKKQVGSNVERLSRQFQTQPSPTDAGSTPRTSLGGPRPRPSGARRIP